MKKNYAHFSVSYLNMIYLNC